MVVSMLQSIWSFCEHRDEDGPADAWQRIEDGHVTMLLPLSRHVLSFLSTNRFGELLAEPIELLFRVSQLAIDDPQLHDHHSDVSSGSLPGPLSDAQGRLAQLTDHMGRVETTDAIALENASNALLARTRSLLGRGDRFPQIERPVSAEVVGDAGVTPYRGLKKLRDSGALAANRVLGVIGVGGLGEYAVQYAKLLGSGATVVALDRNPISSPSRRNTGLITSSVLRAKPRPMSPRSSREQQARPNSMRSSTAQAPKR